MPSPPALLPTILRSVPGEGRFCGAPYFIFKCLMFIMAGFILVNSDLTDEQARIEQGKAKFYRSFIIEIIGRFANRVTTDNIFIPLGCFGGGVDVDDCGRAVPDGYGVVQAAAFVDSFGGGANYFDDSLSCGSFTSYSANGAWATLSSDMLGVVKGSSVMLEPLTPRPSINRMFGSPFCRPHPLPLSRPTFGRCPERGDLDRRHGQRPAANPAEKLP